MHALTSLCFRLFSNIVTVRDRTHVRLNSQYSALLKLSRTGQRVIANTEQGLQTRHSLSVGNHRDRTHVYVYHSPNDTKKH